MAVNTREQAILEIKRLEQDMKKIKLIVAGANRYQIENFDFSSLQQHFTLIENCINELKGEIDDLK